MRSDSSAITASAAAITTVYFEAAFDGEDGSHSRRSAKVKAL